MRIWLMGMRMVLKRGGLVLNNPVVFIHFCIYIPLSIASAPGVLLLCLIDTWKDKGVAKSFTIHSQVL